MLHNFRMTQIEVTLTEEEDLMMSLKTLVDFHHHLAVKKSELHLCTKFTLYLC